MTLIAHGLSLLALFATALSQPLSTVGPNADLFITDSHIAPDGFSRLATVANGLYPGPVITATKGQSFNLNVVNQLNSDTMEEVTSIHWHGIFQAHTNAMDGVDRVTQCPIIPNNSFRYQFSAPGQAGTFWYHSHRTTQYCDGLRGAFVIYDPKDPHLGLYDVDDASTVLVLGDWYHLPAPQLGPVPVPNATTINRFGRNPTNTTAPLSVTNVVAGRRYRLRIVSAACHPMYNFTIDGHNFTIIEADGENTEPLTVDSLPILAGQRYSVVLTAKQPVGNYWIRANPDVGPQGFVGGINSAILHYQGAPNRDPTSNQTASVIPFLEPNLHRLSQPGVPGVPGGPAIGDDVYPVPLALAFNPTTGLFTINNASYKTPSLPVLRQILDGVPPALLVPAGSIITLPRNKTIELYMPASNLAGGPHPFHLHGHAFDVVRSANSNATNFDNPVRRDVVNIGGGRTEGPSNTTIRFVTDNPGPWILHCHIDFHLEAGLAVVFAEAPEDVPSYQNTTAQWRQICDKYNNYEGNSTSSA